MTQARIKPSADVLIANLENEAVLLDLQTGTYYSLNETGAFIWHAVQQGLQGEALLGALSDHFEVDADLATHEMEAFIDELQTKGLLIPVVAP